MNLRAMIIGSHLMLARDGAVTTSGGDPLTVAYNAKPDTSLASNWPFVGRIEDVTITPKLVEDEIMSPSPGAYRRTDVLVGTANLDLKWTVQDVSELFFEMLMLASGGPITTDYAPMAAVGQVRGWWKAQQYSQDDTVRNVFDLWAICTVSATKMDNKRIKAEFNVKALYNALNTGVLSLA